MDQNNLVPLWYAIIFQYTKWVLENVPTIPNIHELLTSESEPFRDDMQIPKREYRNGLNMYMHPIPLGNEKLCEPECYTGNFMMLRDALHTLQYWNVISEAISVPDDWLLRQKTKCYVAIFVEEKKKKEKIKPEKELKDC